MPFAILVGSDLLQSQFHIHGWGLGSTMFRLSILCCTQSGDDSQGED
jgi:hypothetical protein